MQIGWIDFSMEQRGKVLSVLKLLSEAWALDEMGIGIIRDSFANCFFPGTSTIQTRAKYLFIVPYILIELEKYKNIKSHEFLKLLYQKEIELIDVLDKDGAEGVIGTSAKETLKRVPSGTYWNAIKTYGFFADQGLSISEYVKVFCATRDHKFKIKNGGNNRRDEEAVDDLDSVSGMTNFWRVSPPAVNWRDEITIDLTYEEAVYLKQKIITMPSTKDTLFAFILREHRTDFCGYASFDDLYAMMPDLSEGMKADYIMARDFAQFIYGAQIRYNIIFTKGEDEFVNEKRESWKKGVPIIDLEQLFIRHNIKNINLKHFLRSYKNSINNTEELDKLIINREKQLKGASRSKKYGGIEFSEKIWDEMFDEALKNEKGDYPELVPFWCLPGGGEVKIERIVPMYPMSKDGAAYERLIKILSLYRLTLGQARQEELLEYLFNNFEDTEMLEDLFINLSPFIKTQKKEI